MAGGKLLWSKGKLPAIKSGMKLIVKGQFITRANAEYRVGDTLEVLDKTTLSPHGPLPLAFDAHNWLVKCRHFKPPMSESVWAPNAIYSLFLNDLVVVYQQYNSLWNNINL